MDAKICVGNVVFFVLEFLAAIPYSLSFCTIRKILASCQDNLVSKPEFTVAFNLAATDSFLKISSGELERCNFCAWLAAIGMKLSD